MSSNHLHLDDFQEQVAEWVDNNFGSHPAWQPLLGVQEEVGELSHAYLKRHQGIRTLEDHYAAMVDAVGDIIVYLADFCNSEGIMIQDAIEKTWEKVRRRDWNKNPENGISPLDQEVDCPEPEAAPKEEFDRSVRALVDALKEAGYEHVKVTTVRA